MDEPGILEALLRERLPSSLVARMAGPPRKVDAAFLDGDFKQRFADLVVEFPLEGGEVGVACCVLEHKRTADPWLLVQVLAYTSALYSRLARKAKGVGAKLPVVVGLVVYNGVRPWRASATFSSLVEHTPDEAPFVINFQVVVVDLRREADAVVARHPRLKAGLLALKAATVAPSRALARVRRSVEVLRDEPASTFELFLSYTPRVLGPQANALLRQAVTEVAPEKEELMSLVGNTWFDSGTKKGLAEGLKQGLEKGLEQGLEKGRAQGRAQGREDGLRLALTRVLTRRFKKLPVAVRTRVADADAARLERWLDAAIDATSLTAVFRRRRASGLQ
jgi:predicted transposase YdaD